MKRILVALSLISMLFIPAFVQAATVSVSSASGSPGQTNISVVISVGNVSAGIIGVDLTLDYNSSILQAVGVQKGNLPANWTIFSNTAPVGQVKIVLYGTTGLSTSGISLATVTFNVLSTAAAGVTSSLHLSKSNLNEQASSVADGTFTVAKGANHAPVLNPIGNKQVNEGSALVFNISAADPDNDTLTYLATNLPSGATFNASTRSFSWTPTNAQAGSYSPTFSVSDGTLTDSETITITVSNVNRLPVLAFIDDKVIEAGQTLAFTLSATDPDNDPLVYSAIGLPSGAKLSNNAFDWTPNLGQVGVYPVTFKVSDNLGGTDQETINITVSAPSGPAVPDAPTNVIAAAGNAQAYVSFTAPSANGSPITSYAVISSPGGIIATGASSPITVTGLTNRATYNFVVLATNAVGTSPASSTSNSVTPNNTSLPPGPPTGVSAAAGNAQATISFTAPSANGSPITSYTVTSSPGGKTATGAASPITVTGLANGTAYTFTVVATNSRGASPESISSNSVTPAGATATVPGAPTGVSAAAGNAQATISFSAPGSNGGSAITSYMVTSAPGSITASGMASPITITGLTNGTTYTFTVRATNAVGTGSASAASNSVTPVAPVTITVPGAPTGVSAAAGNAQATISFSAPGSNGGSAITSYTVTSSPGAKTATGSASPITVTGLTNGTTYTFTVRATNAVGTGSASAASNSVTPAGATATAPGAPTGVSAAAGNAQATISFSAPGSNGGSAITSYTVTSSSGGKTATGSASPITVTGLTNGTTYTFTVRATNAVGTGSASAASNSVTPVAPVTITVPGAPTGVSAAAGNAQATISFSAPGSNGGSAITSYMVTSAPGSITASGVASPITITGLTNDTAYTFTVKAINTVGASVASIVSNSITPVAPVALTPPTAPENFTGTASAAASTTADVSLSWQENAISFDGLSLQRSTDPTFTTGITVINLGPETTEYIDTGVKRNTKYYYQIQAYNEAGYSAKVYISIITPR